MKRPTIREGAEGIGDVVCIVPKLNKYIDYLEKQLEQMNSSNDIQNVRCTCPKCKGTNTIQLTKTKDRCLDCIHDYYI